jgi:ubiquinone/menaquinone biosynthesis C-methylase UbiE
MLTKKRNRRRHQPQQRKRGKLLNRIVENNLIHRVDFDEYRDKVRDVYGGPKGAILSMCSTLSLHKSLGQRLFKDRKFDLAGAKDILDVGCGAGQITKHLLKYADEDSAITCFDLSHEMVRRSRARLKNDRPAFLVADVTQLPFADETFDCVTCGYVLEHLPDARDGLSELARVMKPGGRMLLLTSEDNFGGAWTSRFWYCRTYNRDTLRQTCADVGLVWKKQLWFTRIHKALKAGGICVEIVKE